MIPKSTLLYYTRYKLIVKEAKLSQENLNSIDLVVKLQLKHTFTD